MTIRDLFPILRPGWVAMDDNGAWWWFCEKPKRFDNGWFVNCPHKFCIQTALSVDFKDTIAPHVGGWENSLIEIKE